MVATVANNEVSPQTQSVESTGQVKHSVKAKKSALGVFAKLLAGLADQRSMRKTKAGGEADGETEAEGLVSGEKTAKKKAGFPGDDKHVLSADNAKIKNRDRNLLAALKGKGETPSPE